MAGTVVADTLQADSTSTLVIKNGVANTPPTIQDSSGTQIGTFCRAWANWNGTSASPITPRASFNVSSITKNGTGDYTVTMTNALADANYSTVAMNNTQTYTSIKSATTPTTSAVNLIIGGASDASFMNVAIFR